MLKDLFRQRDLAQELSARNGKSIRENLEWARKLSEIMPKSVTAVLEYEINRLKIIDRFVIAEYNSLYNGGDQ